MVLKEGTGALAESGKVSTLAPSAAFWLKGDLTQNYDWKAAPAILPQE
jgi:hypothetical protein